MQVIHHPNGFLRVEFSRKPTGEADRLHVWDEPGAQDSDIHQHSYDFTSVVLEGVMREDLYGYREDPDGEWEHWPVICGVGEDGQYRTELGPDPVRVSPVLLATLTHRAGETYVRPAADYHLVTALEVPLVTRVVTGAVADPGHYFMRKRADGAAR